MNSEEIKQQGDEMVERYLPYAYYDPGSVNVLKEQLSNATRCAIRSCEDTIEELNGMLFVMAVLKDPNDEVKNQIAHQKKIIEYLKTKS